MYKRQVHFIPVHQQSYFKELLAGERGQAFPVADAVFPTLVSIPFYPGLTDEMVDRICEEIDGIRQANLDGSLRQVAVVG